ncbi:glycosomal membrane like protein [Leishmania tarentolae]|uniref:Glycosomal membrane like protein n=1 Tax=Leishmania tarentolae TaxID=5689 RepID=A0A640KME8_LEITA|nr:glycosomal membrane like protein [Leishmania tarentolae]
MYLLLLHFSIFTFFRGRLPELLHSPDLRCRSLVASLFSAAPASQANAQSERLFPAQNYSSPHRVLYLFSSTPPHQTFKMSLAVTLNTYMAATDSRDKMIKGAGCFCKMMGALYGNSDFIKAGSAMSDARCLMRMLSWLTNVQKISDAMEKRIVQPRDVLFVLRVLFDGIFSLLDNIVFAGRFFNPNSPHLTQMSYISRASLFYGYVVAVVLDLYDLVRCPNMPKRGDRCLVLMRNTCDLVSAIGNVCPADIGASNVAGLGLISAVIATREQLLAAAAKSGGNTIGAIPGKMSVQEMKK